MKNLILQTIFWFCEIAYNLKMSTIVLWFILKVWNIYILAVTKVAGCSADFVNDVLRHVASGDENGGLKVTPLYEEWIIQFNSLFVCTLSIKQCIDTLQYLCYWYYNFFLTCLIMLALKYMYLVVRRPKAIEIITLSYLH